MPDEESAVRPSDASRAALEREADAIVRRINLTREAVERKVRADHHGIPFSRIRRNIKAFRHDLEGTLPCPICAEQRRTGTLTYKILGINGHMAVRCDVSGCVDWRQ
jgi:hypothetical protein